MHLPTLIEAKRDGRELSVTEIEFLIRAFTRGEMPDYQMSALAMAIYFRGMTGDETAHLTRAMMESGRVLAYPAGSPAKVDKHSTGGVGDKVSLVLAPLLAATGAWVPMISGRGLGLTGGTLDKLESIPGFQVQLGEKEALAQLAKIGVFMIGQTADICPADKKLYALRDVTGTVPSAPLIIASIMSKKLAENLDRLVLDVKFGSGAFMKTEKDARELAQGLSAIGEKMGVAVSHVLSPMHEPLGHAVGHALEVREAVATLQGRGPRDLEELTLDLAGQVSDTPRTVFKQWLQDGTAWKKFQELVKAQGGDVTALEKITEMHRAPIVHELCAEENGVLTRMDAESIGRACVLLGAGRAQASDAIDYAVGCDEILKVGTAVERGARLCAIHARHESSLHAALPLFKQAVTLG